MSRYRRVDVCVWNDAKFRSMPDDSRMLWLHLLTSPESIAISGVIVSGQAGVAESMQWLPQRLAEPFSELLARGMIRADFGARMIWLPNGIHRNPPSNPNGVLSWSNAWDEVPECDLKRELWHALKPLVDGLCERFKKPLPKPLRKPFEELFPEPMPQQDRDRDRDPFPDPDLDKFVKTTSRESSGATPTTGGQAKALWDLFAEIRVELGLSPMPWMPGLENKPKALLERSGRTFEQVAVGLRAMRDVAKVEPKGLEYLDGHRTWQEGSLDYAMTRAAALEVQTLGAHRAHRRRFREVTPEEIAPAPPIPSDVLAEFGFTPEVLG